MGRSVHSRTGQVRARELRQLWRWSGHSGAGTLGSDTSGSEDEKGCLFAEYQHTRSLRTLNNEQARSRGERCM